MQEVTAGQF